MTERSLRNALYLIAAICVGIAVLNVFEIGAVTGNHIPILLGIAVIALLAPNLENFTLGKDGVSASLKAAKQLDRETEARINQLYEEIRVIKASLGGDQGRAAEGIVAYGDGVVLPDIQDKTDPQKGRFGGESSRNGKTLTARVERSALRPDWCSVTLVVSSKGKSLTGDVVFYLHDTFKPNRFVETAANGVATLSVSAWGAFTVGAIVKSDGTLLELDLADGSKVEAPKDWQAR